MSSPFDARCTATGAAAGLRFNGEAVTHYPGGSSPGVSVTAIVTYMDTQVQAERGMETVQKAIVQVPDSVTCLKSDRWTLGGKEYQATAVGEPQGGLIEVQAQRRDTETRREGGSVI